MPLVDVYRAGNAEKLALAAELDSAKGIAATLESFEKRVAEQAAQLAALEARTVDDESLPALRGKLVDLAKETGCSIRRLNVGTVSSRPWVAGDDPLSLDTQTSPTETVPTGFVLQWRPVSLSLSGSSASLRSLMERVAAAKMFMHAKSVEMFPSSPSRQSLTLDMELWYFTLVRRG
jgi:hypothetical protein